MKWKDVKGYEGLYIISDNGEVKSLDRFVDNRWGGKVFKKSKYISIRKSSNGYLRCSLINDKKVSVISIHRLVAEAFIPNQFNKPCVNHINSNRSDNNVNNLEWVTYSENNQHAHNMGRHTLTNKISSNRMKLLHKQKSKILKNYV